MAIVEIDRLGRGARTGRVSVGLALVLALIICGSVSYFLFRTGAPGDGPRSEDGGSRAAELSEPADGAPVAPRAIEETRSAAPAGEASPGVTALAHRRIHGTVTDDTGTALAGMAVRWLPIGRHDLSRYSHDSRALGRDADPERIPAGRVREALSRSEVTSSAEDGAYELRVPLAGEPGVVVASGSGYEMAIRSADPDRPESPREVLEAPEPAAPAIESASESRDVEIHFRLGRAGAISGKVTDIESGEAVAGMTVVAGVVDPESPAMMSYVQRDAPSSVVREDGTYLIDGLKPAEYRVLPRTGDSDYVAFSTRQAAKVALEAGAEVVDVDFEVARGARIFGRVTGPRDQPVQGAKCKVLPTDLLAASMSGDVEAITMLDSREDRTDADGFYEVRGVPRGQKYRVAVEADEHAAARSEVIEPAGESLEVNIALTPGSSISGRVFTARGDPAPGTPVNIMPDIEKIMAGNYDQIDNRAAETDDSGAFRLEHLAAGEYRLYPGKLRPQDLWGNRQKEGEVVPVDGIHDVSGVELTLPDTEAGTLAGIVTDDEGTPIEEASIQVMQPEDFMGMSSKNLTTGADGRFSVSGLQGAIFRIGASKAGYSSVRLNDVAIDTTGVEIVLDRHGRVTGRVTTLADVSLAPGGKVKARRIGGESFLESLQSIQNIMPGGRDGTQEVSLSPDGTFSVEAPAGTIEILATVPSFAPAVSRSLTVSPGQELMGVEILVTGGAVVHGRVTFSGMESVQGATVTVSPFKEGDTTDMMSELMPQMFAKSRNQATTDADGRFEVLHLAPGQYKVMAIHGDYAPSGPLTVSLARDQARDVGDLVLTLGGSIAGVVIHEDSPKAGMMVQLLGGGPMKQTTTSPEGTFEFRGLRPGEYMLNFVDFAAMQKGKMMVKTRPVTVADAETTDLEVVFGSGNRVYGKITGLPPGPLRMVTLRRPGGPAPEDLDPTDIQGGIAAARYQAGVAMIAPDGAYEIEDVESGEYFLEIPRMASDPTDLEAYKTLDRTPHYRKEIRVEEADVEVDIVVK